MDLSSRISTILYENNLSRKDFADTLGITENYVVCLLKNRNTRVSLPLAYLIEERYGYSSEWVLGGVEPKVKSESKNKSLSAVHKRAITQIENMSARQVKAVLAFASSLERLESEYKNSDADDR